MPTHIYETAATTHGFTQAEGGEHVLHHAADAYGGWGRSADRKRRCTRRSERGATSHARWRHVARGGAWNGSESRIAHIETGATLHERCGNVCAQPIAPQSVAGIASTQSRVAWDAPFGSGGTWTRRGRMWPGTRYTRASWGLPQCSWTRPWMKMTTTSVAHPWRSPSTTGCATAWAVVWIDLANATSSKGLSWRRQAEKSGFRDGVAGCFLYVLRVSSSPPWTTGRNGRAMGWTTALRRSVCREKGCSAFGTCVVRHVMHTRTRKGVDEYAAIIGHIRRRHTTASLKSDCRPISVSPFLPPSHTFFIVVPLLFRCSAWPVPNLCCLGSYITGSTRSNGKLTRSSCT